MPKNRFPDTREKRELRRRDARKLKVFSDRVGRRLSYCGLPSVEFLDIEAWKQVLSSVTAFEDDDEAYDDMLIERDRKDYPFPVVINPAEEKDILRFLVNSEYCFDLYNLDFFGGLVYPGKDGQYRSTEAIRQIFAEQSRCRRSFVLIATFNVRDKGAAEYSAFLESARQGVAGRQNALENMKSHDENQTNRLKLCFPFFCWQQAHASGFEHMSADVTKYKSSAVMVHFLETFEYKGVKLPPLPPTGMLIEMANRPLYEMAGQIHRVSVVFPSIG